MTAQTKPAEPANLKRKKRVAVLIMVGVMVMMFAGIMFRVAVYGP